jgi:Skp family chaperone for outer membrane proteins
MKVMIRTGLVLLVGLACCLPAMAAAAPDKADKVAAGMLKFDDVIKEAQAKISGVLGTMNSLSAASGADLADKYKAFAKQVTDLDATAKKAKSRAEDAKAKRDEYLKQVQESQAQIKNEQLKAAAEARRAELQPKIETLRDALTSAGQTFTPLMQDLKDLSVYLGTNLSAQGIASAADMMTKCTDAGAKVNADLEKGSTAVRDLAASISPTSAAAAKK